MYFLTLCYQAASPTKTNTDPIQTKQIQTFLKYKQQLS